MSDSRTAEILDADERRRAALIAGDIALLDRLLSDDLIHVHASGHACGKAEYFRDLKTWFAFLAIERSNLAVRFLGDAALLTGGMVHRVRLHDSGKIIVMDAFGSQIWVPSADGWQQVFYQATEIKPGS